MSLETFVEDLRWRHDDDEDRQREQEKLEQYERYIYLMQDTIKNFEESKPEDWLDILEELKRYLEEIEEL